METRKYSRRPFDVEAVRVTKANMDDVAKWCQGEVIETPPTATARAERFIRVEVHTPANERQSRAFPGDFVLLLEGGRSFKVYTAKAFNKNFVLAENQDATTPAPVAKKAAKKRTPKKQTQHKRPPINGLKPDARAALAKMGQGMKKAATSTIEKVQETSEVVVEKKDEVTKPNTKGTDEPTFYVDSTTEGVKEHTPAETGKDETPAAPVEATDPTPMDSPELQVVERPIENTTEPRLEVTEAPEVKPDGTKRKFIQKN